MPNTFGMRRGAPVWLEWMSVRRDSEVQRDYSPRVLLLCVAILLAVFRVIGAVSDGAVGTAVLFSAVTVALGWLTVRELRR